jgi:cell division protein FtsB
MEGTRLGDLRWLVALLALGAVLMQVELWFSADGYRKTRALRAAVAEQRAENERLRARNAALDAEVINLKQGLEAAEERARTDLGLIGENETFYQVVPATD